MFWLCIVHHLCGFNEWLWTVFQAGSYIDLPICMVLHHSMNRGGFTKFKWQYQQLWCSVPSGTLVTRISQSWHIWHRLKHTRHGASHLSWNLERERSALVTRAMPSTSYVCLIYLASNVILTFLCSFVWILYLYASTLSSSGCSQNVTMPFT